MNASSPQRGAGLIEGLVAIAILALGVLGLAKFQVGTLSETTDSQSRVMAATLVDELLTEMRVDAGNVDCYTLPQEGTCSHAVAEQQANAWLDRARADIPGFVSATASRDGSFRFVVRIQWSSKAFSETRSLEVRTDVRP